MEKVLVNTDKYNGLYVAMKDFDDGTIIGVGNDPQKALKDAEKKKELKSRSFYTSRKKMLYRFIFNVDSNDLIGLDFLIVSYNGVVKCHEDIFLVIAAINRNWVELMNSLIRIRPCGHSYKEDI